VRSYGLVFGLLRGWEFCPFSPFFAKFSTFTKIPQVPSFQAHSRVVYNGTAEETLYTLAYGNLAGLFVEAIKELKGLRG